MLSSVPADGSTSDNAVADATSAAPRKPCDYVWGARCVTWVTTLYSCHNIFQITNDTRKHSACAIFADRGIVTVWP
jgi:hypothetical protein